MAKVYAKVNDCRTDGHTGRRARQGLAARKLKEAHTMWECHFATECHSLSISSSFSLPLSFTVMCAKAWRCLGPHSHSLSLSLCFQLSLRLVLYSSSFLIVQSARQRACYICNGKWEHRSHSIGTDCEAASCGRSLMFFILAFVS